VRQKHGGTQHHKGGVLVSAFSSASAAATSAAFSPLHVIFVVDMAGDSPIIVPALRATTMISPAAGGKACTVVVDPAKI